MKVLWITWKDRFHPNAGGAEIICRELTERLHQDGHSVTMLTCGYKNAKPEEQVGNIRTIRIGSNRYTHPMQALMYFVRHMRNSFDVIIEEVNGGAPYFSVFFDRKAKSFLFYHQLARQNWFFETKPPLSYFGYYAMEPAAQRLLSRSKTPVITVSESTRQDLAKFGFQPQNTHIISEGIEISPAENLEKLKKYRLPTMLSLGNIRPMKRTMDQIKAFERAKRSIPDLRLKIVGEATGKYGQQVMAAVKNSKYAKDIEYLGRVSRWEKQLLMRRSHVICVTSVKEGWGLIVTEAASQGTPAVVYNIDGLRDSVRHNQTGIVTPPRPVALADGIINLLNDRQRYDRLRTNAWKWSKSITFDQCYKDFKNIIFA